MLAPLASPKIRPDHLDRPAFVYVRQSTLVQVREHTASTARQYDLVRRAHDLGWSTEAITVIDQDQGRSGASAAGRDGFQFLIAQVGLGQAGAVLSLEASRLARSCSDWYRLLEICALTDTLVIDEDGVYDPGQYADRLLLGFLGTMSEAELHWLRDRLLGGKLEKPARGTARQAADRPGLRRGRAAGPRPRRGGAASGPAGVRAVRARRLGAGGRQALSPPSTSCSPRACGAKHATANCSGSRCGTAGSWTSCTTRPTPAPTSTAAPRPAPRRCPARRRG